MKEYPLLEQQKNMLNNLRFMLQADNKNDINLARRLILEEPLIGDIILVNETRPLKTLMKHKFVNRFYNPDPYSFAYSHSKDYNTFCRIRQIARHMEDTVDHGIYFMYK